MYSDKIKHILAELLSIPSDSLQETDSLSQVLMDSFAIIDLSLAIQDKLDILFTQSDLLELDTVADLIKLIQTKQAITN